MRRTCYHWPMRPELHAACFKKSVDARWGKRRVRIDLAEDVFSSHQLDVGSRFLMRQMEKAGVHYQRALDVGCGYGLIGLHLAATGIAERVIGFDRDALAVAFANHNASQNDIAHARFQTALVYDNGLGGDYGAVVTNLPAKAGDGVHRLVLLGAQRLVSPGGGEVWAVVVGPLERRIDAILAHPNIDRRDKQSRGGHIVYRFVFTGEVPLPDRPYHRGHHTFTHKGASYEMDAWWGLAEFDTLSIDTRLMADLLADHLRSEGVSAAAVVEPGQGHLPLFISRCAGGEVDLFVQSRDAMATAATQHNLQLNGHGGKREARVTADLELDTSDQLPGVIAVKLNDQVRHTTSANMIGTWLKQCPGATIITGSRAAYANRVSELLARHGVETTDRTKHRGFAALRLGVRTP